MAPEGVDHHHPSKMYFRLQKMKKLIAYTALALALFVVSCQQDPTVVNKKNNSSLETGLTMLQEDNAAWQHENLRIYPVLADDALIAAHTAQANVKTLEDAMGARGFRITELKNFGRESGNWYNGLTLVNKSADTVFIMSGDVVTGGNQDRVNEEDLMALPGTIRNFPVFCVEHGRSTYYNPEASASEKQLAAFKGYYSVASPRVRKAVYEGDQNKVWSAVSNVTSANNATSTTSAYAALEGEDLVRARCQSYTDFFTGKFETIPNAVGLVAVSNGKVIGVEIFGHPNLFQRRIKSLVHSYAVEAAMQTETTSEAAATTDDINAAFTHVARKARENGKSDETAGRVDYGGTWLHLFSH